MGKEANASGSRLFNKIKIVFLKANGTKMNGNKQTYSTKWVKNDAMPPNLTSASCDFDR